MNAARCAPNPHGSSTSSKMSWNDVHMGLREWRRNFSHLYAKVPNDITFRELGSNLLRCYFLLSPGQGREHSLYFADINLDQNASNPIHYAEVLDTSTSCFWKRASKEEQLQSERRRVSTWGIIHYELHRESGTLVFPAASTIFQCIHPERPVGPTSVKELVSNKVRLNPQICPCNENIIVFSANFDIYLYYTVTGEEIRLTSSHKGQEKLAEDPISSGVPSYVIQEEFSRFDGYWWQPTCENNVYRLLYEEVDETEVPIVQFISPDDSTGMLEEFRFPRPGKENAKSSLVLLELEIGGKLNQMRITKKRLKHSLKELAPWYEYLVRVGWLPDGSQIWCQLLDRKQQRLDLVLLPLSAFGVRQSSLDEKYGCELNVPPCSLLIQASNTWIDVHNMLYWFETDRANMDPYRKMFIIASEETGFRHLYFYIVYINPNSGGSQDSQNHGLPDAQVLQKIPLTSGNWCVLGNGLWVDEEKGLVYFMGVKDTPLEQHLYVTSLSKPCVVQRITQPNFYHSVFMNSDCSVFVTSYSNIKTPPQSQVFRIMPSENSDVFVWVKCLGSLISEAPSDALLQIKPLVVPDISTTILPTGEQIYSMAFKPHNYVRGQKYPTVLHIYGGPQVQLVTNTFKGYRHMRTHMLAAHGFCVVSIDSRGSDNRGTEFQSHLFSRMGTVEVEDQLDVLKQLAQHLDYIDLNRLGVFGWSYGGYLSLMALAQRPDYFKVAIAGAPVVSWNLYDTGYTERYMDVPLANPKGYRNGSVLTYASNFPDQENRLLIVQGMIDENVHFFHTNKLIQALIKFGKPYQLQVYPRERHCLRHMDSNEHYETKMLSFLLQNL